MFKYKHKQPNIELEEALKGIKEPQTSNLLDTYKPVSVVENTRWVKDKKLMNLINNSKKVIYVLNVIIVIYSFFLGYIFEFVNVLAGETPSKDFLLVMALIIGTFISEFTLGIIEARFQENKVKYKKIDLNSKILGDG